MSEPTCPARRKTVRYEWNDDVVTVNDGAAVPSLWIRYPDGGEQIFGGHSLEKQASFLRDWLRKHIMADQQAREGKSDE